jgi:2,3-bisphosphoglycerate-dependent phosphoglycerate mutase
MRHGQSKWNASARFTGWADIGLTTEGEGEAARAGAALRELGFEIDRCFTSMLKRSIRTAWIIMGEMQMHWVPVTPTWALNERHYGALTGMSKPEAMAKLGADDVGRWRRSWQARPPPIEADHPLFHRLVDRRYGSDRSASSSHGLSVKLPSAESLEDVSQRVVELWESDLGPCLRRGEQVLVVAHAHTLRALIKHIDGISNDEIEELTIPTVSSKHGSMLSFFSSRPFDFTQSNARRSDQYYVGPRARLLSINLNSFLPSCFPSQGTPLVYTLKRDTLTALNRRAMAGIAATPGAGGEAKSAFEVPVEDVPVVPTGQISEAAQAEGRKLEGAPHKPITICNRTWRVLSGPGVIEDTAVLHEYRKVADDANASMYGGSMIYLSEALLGSMQSGRVKTHVRGRLDGDVEFDMATNDSDTAAGSTSTYGSGPGERSPGGEAKTTQPGDRFSQLLKSATAQPITYGLTDNPEKFMSK